MIEAGRRHGHSDPRYPVEFFEQFSGAARARRALLPVVAATRALDEWESEGGASASPVRAVALRVSA
jgi:hypothetical protein